MRNFDNRTACVCCYTFIALLLALVFSSIDAHIGTMLPFLSVQKFKSPLPNNRLR